MDLTQRMDAHQPDHRGPLDPKTSAGGAPRTVLKKPTQRRNP
jgi:hypothetical protein